MGTRTYRSRWSDERRTEKETADGMAMVRRTRKALELKPRESIFIFNFPHSISRKVRSVVALLFRAIFVAGSANWVTVKGKRVSSKEAPILVGAPHSSFFDTLVVLVSGPGTIVGKVEASAIPFFGSE